MIRNTLIASAIALAALPVFAAVSADEAARLKGDLTPFGAEKAANKEGTIPVWNGGYTTPIPGDKPAQHTSFPSVWTALRPIVSPSASTV